MNKILTCLLALGLGACSALPGLEGKEHGDLKKRNSLFAAITSLGPGVSRSEALKIANVGVYYPKELARRYRLVKPPSLHNSLVNINLKPRGLCFHWANDIQNRLRTLNLKTVDVHWGVANAGELFDEHSSVIITAKGQNFYGGILIDGWRNSGDTYWNYVKRDPKYKWHPFRKIIQLNLG